MSLNLKESARSWVISHLPYDRSNAVLDAYVNGLDLHSLLIAYHNWMTRTIPAVPRRVVVSATLNSKLTSHPAKAAIDQIIADIESGAPLKKYLSKKTSVAIELPRNDIKYQKRNDLDLMLNEWDVHHLHLSTNEEADGYVTRTNDLLFAVFRQGSAFLVDILPHGNWVEENLLRILLDELPEARAVAVLKDVVDLTSKHTPAGYQQIRNSATNSPRMIDGRAVTSTNALSAAGTGLRAGRDADQLELALEDFETIWRDKPETIRAQFHANGVTLPDAPEFAFEMNPKGAGILEKKTGTFIKLP